MKPNPPKKKARSKPGSVEGSDSSVDAKLKRIHIAQRFSEILELRKGGFNSKMIAEQLGTTPKIIDKMLDSYLRKCIERNVNRQEEERQLELERLDQMLVSLWIRRADPKVAQTILQIHDRRAKLTGADTVRKEEEEQEDLSEAIRAKLFG